LPITAGGGNGAGRIATSTDAGPGIPIGNPERCPDDVFMESLTKRMAAAKAIGGRRKALPGHALKRAPRRRAAGNTGTTQAETLQCGK